MNNVEQSVLQMRFDNAQFERGINQSVQSLDRFNKACDQTVNKKGFGDGLKNLGIAAGKVSFDGITKGLDAVQQKFSFLEVFAYNVFNRISNNAISKVMGIVNAIPNQIKNGGWQRALNIENAQFKLKGLDIAWKSVNKDLLYAVNGTAYGLDSAASAAAQLATAGVKINDNINLTADNADEMIAKLKGVKSATALQNNDLDQMAVSLRAIAGVASMTGKSYDQVSQHFIRMATQGKVTGRELTYMSLEGINVTAALADYLGKTNDQIRDMVSNGEISFDTFADAMYDKFADHTTEANKTFQGALANARAALSKIGADVATNLLPALTKILNSFRELTNVMRVKLQPVTTAISNRITKDGDAISKRLDDIKTKADSEDMTATLKLVGRMIDSVGKSFDTAVGFASNFWDSFKGANKIDLKNILGQSVLGVEGFTKNFQNALDQYNKYKSIENKSGKSTTQMENLMGGADNLRVAQNVQQLADAASGVGHAFNIARNAIVAFFQTIRPLVEATRPVAEGMLSVIGSLGRLVGTTDEVARSGNTFYDLFKSIVDFIFPPFTKACNMAADALEWIADKIDNINTAIKGNKIGEFFDNIQSKAGKAGKGLSEFSKSFSSGISESLSNAFKSFKDSGGVAGFFKQLGGIAWKGISEGIELIGKALSFIVGDGSLIEKLGRVINVSMAAGGLAGIINLVKGTKNAKDLTKDLKKGTEKEGIVATISHAIFGKTGAAGTLVKNIFQPFAQLADAVTGDNGILKKLDKFLKSNKLGQIAKVIDSVGKSFLEISVGLLVISGALKVVSSINSDGLNRSVKALLVMLGSIGLVLGILSGDFSNTKLLQANAKDNKFIAGIKGLINSQGSGSLKTATVAAKLFGIGTAFLEISGGLLMIAGALKITSKIKEGDLTRSVGALLAMLVTIGVLLAVIGGNYSAGKGFNLKNFSLKDGLSFLKGNNEKTWKTSGVKMLAAGAAFDEIANGLLVIATSLKIVSSISDPTVLSNSCGALLLMLIAIGVTLGVLSGTKKTVNLNGKTIKGAENIKEIKSFSGFKMVGVGAAFMEIGASLLEVAASLKIVSTIDSDKMASSLVVLLSCLGAIGIALGILGGTYTGDGGVFQKSLNFKEGINIIRSGGDVKKVTSGFKMIGVGAAFMEIGGSMLEIAAALKITSSMSSQEMFTSATGLIGCLAVIGIILGKLSGTYTGGEFKTGLKIDLDSGLQAFRSSGDPQKVFSGFKMIGVGAAFMEIGASLLEIATSLKITSGLSSQEMFTSATALIVCLAIIGVILGKLSGTYTGGEFTAGVNINLDEGLQAFKNSGDPQKILSGFKMIGVGAAFLEVGGAMLEISNALKTTSGMSIGEILTSGGALVGGLAVIGIILGLMAGTYTGGDAALGLNFNVKEGLKAYKEAGDPQKVLSQFKMVGIGAAFLEMAGSMRLIADAMNQLKGMDLASIVTTAGTLLTMLGVVAGIATAVSGIDAKDAAIGAGVLLGIAGAFDLLSHAIKNTAEGISILSKSADYIVEAIQKLCAINDEYGTVSEMLNSLGNTYISLGVALAASGLFGTKSKGIALTDVAKSTKSLASAVETLAGIGDYETASGLLEDIGNAYKEFGTAIKDSGLFAEGKAEAMANVAASTKKLAQGIQILSGVTDTDRDAAFKDVMNYLKEMASYDFGPAQTNLSDFGTILKNFGSDVNEGSSGVDKFKAAVDALVGSISSIDTSRLNSFGANMATTINDGFTASSAAIVNEAKAVVSEIGKAFTNSSDGIGTTLQNAMTESANGALKAKTSFTNAGKSFATAVGDGFYNNAKSITKYATSVAKSLVDKMNKQKSSFTNTGKSFSKAVGSGMKSSSSDISSVALSMSKNAANKAKSAYSAFYDDGKNFGEGVARGMESKRNRILAVARSLGIDSAKAFAKAQDSHSPSKVGIKLGGYFPEGIAIGMKRMAYKVIDAAKSLAVDEVASIGYDVQSTGYSGGSNGINRTGFNNSYGLNFSGQSGTGSIPNMIKSQNNNNSRTITIAPTVNINGNYTPADGARIARDIDARLGKIL